MKDEEIYLTLKTIREASLFGYISLSFMSLFSFDYFEICDGYVAGFYIPKMWNKKNVYKGIITHKCIKIHIFEEIHKAIVDNTDNKNEVPYVDQYHPVADVLRNIETCTDYIKPYWYIWHFNISLDNERLSHGVQNSIERNNIEFIDNLIEPAFITDSIHGDRSDRHLFKYNDAGFMKVMYAGKPNPTVFDKDWHLKGISSFKKKFKLSKDWKECYPSKRKEFIKKRAVRNLFDESILIETLKS